MGGDYAPLEIVKGAVLAVEELGINIILTGDKQKINQVFEENGLSKKNIEIIHTDKVITMEDDPLSVVKTHKDSSMGLAFNALVEDRGDALVSAGNTGAILSASTLIVKRIKGIKRAALGVVLPYQRKTLLIDAGASIDVNAESLKQFGVMGAIYMKKIFNIDSPTVGLANNGEEKIKGTPEHVKAYELLSETKNINFVGNIEGKVIPINCSDVLVTDGFTGNMILKLTEGFGSFMGNTLKNMFLKDAFSKISAVFVKKSLKDLKESFDYSEYGGVPLFGVTKPVIKAHGNSNAKAVKNAIRQAKFCVETKIVEEIKHQTEING